MIRRVAREMVLQSLFQMDFTQATADEALQVALEVSESGEAPKAAEYARALLKATTENISEIDALIGKYAVNWDVERMPGVDRNILRMAICEMIYAEEKVPVNIAVNEAVELAKRFGTDKTPRFINGVLGKIMRDRQGK